jgi:hypothetical protein
LAYFTMSRVTTGTLSRSMPSFSSEGPAVSMRPLVAMAQGMEASVSATSSSRAPGNGRISSWRRFSAAAWATRSRRFRSRSITSPVSRNSMLVKSPPLMPMRRWMRQTDRVIPSDSSASLQARTCW